MSIQVKFFGQLEEVVGKSKLDVNGVDDIDSLKEKMFVAFPKLKNYHFVIAVHKKIINENQTLKSGDEVALLPPFSGG